jgi:hypothetical protein
MSYDTKTAGRELDALIAERVCGWERVRFTGPPDDFYGHEPGREGNGHLVPRYSTDIAAAWLVAEKLRLTVTPTWSPANGDCWQAARCNWMQSGETNAVGMTNNGQWTKGETAPLAICLAALKEVG